jgi:hypothetical protein
MEDGKINRLKHTESLQEWTSNSFVESPFTGPADSLKGGFVVGWA